jgi:hypothetical protein
LGDVYSLTLKVIDIETATVAVSYLADLAKTSRIEALMASGGGAGGMTTASSSSKPTAQGQTEPNNSIIVFPSLGTWKIVGKDSSSWTGDWIIEELNGQRFSGFIRWYRNGNVYSGTEYYSGKNMIKNNEVRTNGT